MTPLKGKLLDRMTVTDNADALIPLLPVGESQVVSLASWRFLVAKIVDEAGASPQEEKRLYEWGGPSSCRSRSALRSAEYSNLACSDPRSGSAAKGSTECGCPLPVGSCCLSDR